MALLPEVKSEFLRSIYDSGADFAARKALLDGYRNVAMKTMATGKTLIGASGSGVSSQFEQIEGFQPSVVLQLVKWCRNRISAADIDAALAVAPIEGVTMIRARFSGLTG